MTKKEGENVPIFVPIPGLPSGNVGNGNEKYQQYQQCFRSHSQRSQNGWERKNHCFCCFFMDVPDSQPPYINIDRGRNKPVPHIKY